VFELAPSLYVVELKKSHGDPELYRQVRKLLLSCPWLHCDCRKETPSVIFLLEMYLQLCERIGSDLGVLKMEQIFRTQPVADDLVSLGNRSATPLVAL
jgi:5'-AMP-activated protein kinase catalytic alpha subunit